MLRSRIIPCLLVHQGGLVKTQRFGNPKYVGDPLNAVRIFNEKEADELIVLDIDATAEGRGPDYRLIEALAAQCRMPLCYGGGVTDSSQIKRIVASGVEKVAIGSALITHPGLIQEATTQVGRQSIVAVIDYKKAGFPSRPRAFVLNGTRATGLHPVELAKKADMMGAGEIVLNSIDRDGMMTGFDLEMLEQVREVTGLPVTILGGAGSVEEMHAVDAKYGPLGMAAGSLFVFKGQYRAVLINYPTR